MEPLSLSDNEVYGPIQGHLVLSAPTFNPAMAALLHEIAVLLVYDNSDMVASIYLTKEQAIELRDYLNKLIKENTTNV